MNEMPVSTHEQVIAGLTPAMDALRDELCRPLPPAGKQEILFFSSWVSDFGKQSEAIMDSVVQIGNVMMTWQGEEDTKAMLSQVDHASRTMRGLEPVRQSLMCAEFDTRSVLLAMIDCFIRDLLGWFGRYEGIVLHPEAWQGENIELVLKPSIAEESAALERFLAQKEIVLPFAIKQSFVNSANIKESAAIKQEQKKDVGIMGLLAAFGFGLWIGGDD